MDSGRHENPILTLSSVNARLDGFYYDLASLMDRYDVTVVSGRLDDLRAWIAAGMKRAPTP